MAKKNKTKGEPFSLRPELWVEEASEHYAKQATKETGVDVLPSSVLRGIFKCGVEPFFKQNNLPIDENGWRKFLKETIEEIES